MIIASVTRLSEPLDLRVSDPSNSVVRNIVEEANCAIVSAMDDSDHVGLGESTGSAFNALAN